MDSGNVVQANEACDNDANLRELVRVEQVDMAMRLAPLMLVLDSLAIGFLVWLFWTPEHSVLLLTTLSTITLLAGGGLICCRLWHDNPNHERISIGKLVALCGYAAAFGTALGYFPVSLYVEGDMAQRMLIAATWAGLIGTAMTVAIMPAIATSFMAPLVGFCFYGLFAAGDRISLYVAGLLVIYATFLGFLTSFLSALVKKRVVAQTHLEREQALTNLLLHDFEENANDWLWETDAELRLRHVSERLSQVASRPRRELIDMPLLSLFTRNPNQNDDAFMRLKECVATRRAFRDILLAVPVAGERRWWLVSGKPMMIGTNFAGYRGVGADVTIKKQAEDRLSYLVLHDSLTDLPNRLYFQQQLNKIVLDADQTAFAVLCLDLDEFKGVNDTLGHGAGDKLLQAVAARLETRLEGVGGLVARLAGDEFAVLLSGPHAADRTKLADLCNHIVADIGVPFAINEAQVHIGVSIGVATAPEDGVHELMRRADLALYQSKRDGKNGFRFYQADMDEQINYRRALGADMQLALERNEFQLYFQPLVNAATSKIVGFEALLRWFHPTRGLIPPTEFIPIAEENGAIAVLGRWIIDEACRIASTWEPPVTVAVNISPIQFRHSDIPTIVSNALAKYGLPPHRLELELTESAFLESSPTTQRILQSLADLGIRLSLDDFGTGYSSLSYLRRIAFNKIKIDRSFVLNLPDDTRDLSIVRAIVDIATTMGVATIAEGVETEEQRACLLAQGCHQLQGYLFSRPVPADQVPALLGAPPRQSDRKSAAA